MRTPVRRSSLQRRDQLLHIRADLPRIRLPDARGHHRRERSGAVGRLAAWQQTIRDSELLVIPGNSFHVAASDAERCALATLDFIDRRGAV